MKKKTVIEELDGLARDITEEVACWQYINEYGCQDPLWPDGTNMNIVRNHIIYDKREIERLCSSTGAAFPDEYYIETPPEVPDGYMASVKNDKYGRVKRLQEQGEKLARARTKYNSAQSSIF